MWVPAANGQRADIFGSWVAQNSSPLNTHCILEDHIKKKPRPTNNCNILEEINFAQNMYIFYICFVFLKHV